MDGIPVCGQRAKFHPVMSDWTAHTRSGTAGYSAKVPDDRVLWLKGKQGRQTIDMHSLREEGTRERY